MSTNTIKSTAVKDNNHKDNKCNYYLKILSGNMAYSIREICNEYYENCPICEGRNKIEIKSHEYDCPNTNCFDGKVRKVTPIKWGIFRVGQVDSITIEYRKGKWERVYYQSGNGSIDKDIFPTKESALKECNKRNTEMLNSGKI